MIPLTLQRFIYRLSLSFHAQAYVSWVNYVDFSLELGGHSEKLEDLCCMLKQIPYSRKNKFSLISAFFSSQLILYFFRTISNKIRCIYSTVVHVDMHLL